MLFAAAMVCFTGLSRAAQSAATAVVETKKAVSGKITHQISASGRIEAGSAFDVLVPEGIKIEKIYAKEGDEVKKGDVLFATAGNTKLARAREDFLAWERKASMDANEYTEQYLQAYEDWRRYLAKTEGWYWKAEDDLKEDELELAVRETEFAYLNAYKTYLDGYAEEEKIRLGSLTGDLERAQGKTEDAQNTCQKLQKEENAAKKEYWAYKRNRERPYQFSRKDEEKTYREALEKAIPGCRNALQEYESGLLTKLRAAEDSFSSSMDEAGNVISPVSGVIRELSAKEGALTAASACAVIALSDGEKEVRVQADAALESYLAVGDACVLKKYGAADGIGGSAITEVKYNEKDAAFLDLTVEVHGDGLSVGDMVTVDVSKQSETYPFVLPLDSIRMESGETYVLAVKERDGILGKVLEAEKLSVKILEQNSDYAAVSSDGIADREIIVGTDREVEAEGRVRKRVL